jgi:hypothetical protein
MSGLFGFIAFIGLIGVVVALVALARGRLKWARITTRKVAAVALASSFAVFVAGVTVASATSHPQLSTPGTSAPATASTTQSTSAAASATATSAAATGAKAATVPAATATRVVPSTTAVTKAPPPVVVTTKAPPPPPASLLTCTASMSNSQPADYSATDVIVATGVAGAGVTTTAHYKTTDTTHTAVAGANGNADIPYRISRATVGYQVNVDVTVTAQGTTQSCSTSFTPR